MGTAIFMTSQSSRSKRASTLCTIGSDEKSPGMGMILPTRDIICHHLRLATGLRRNRGTRFARSQRNFYHVRLRSITYGYERVNLCRVLAAFRTGEPAGGFIGCKAFPRADRPQRIEELRGILS